MASRTLTSTGLSPSRVVIPGLLEFFLVGTATAMALIGTVIGVRVPGWMNYAVPTLLSLGLAAGVVTLVRRDVAGMWTALLWFRVAMIAYSGIGSMVPLFANDTTLDQINAFFQLYPGDMIRYNLVTCLFAFVLLSCAGGAALLAERVLRGRPSRFAPAALSQGKFGLACLVLGLTAKLLVLWPPVLFNREVNAPAFITSVALFALLGYALLAAWCLDNRRYGRLALLTLVMIIDSAIGVLGFNKSEALLPLVFFVLGVLFDRPTLFRVGLMSGLVVLVYLVITPIVTYGRLVVDFNRLNTTVTLSDRIDAVGGYDRDLGGEHIEQVQGSWSRLTYISEGSFAMSQYDRGLPGDTLDDVIKVLIPRFLYPDKPEITRFGVEFNVLKSGNDLSQSLPGIPAEGYWDLGFPGVVLFASLMGVAFGLWSVYAVTAVRQRAWHLFLVAILGVHCASRIDGLFVADFEASIVLGVIAHFVLTFVNDLLERSPALEPVAATA